MILCFYPRHPRGWRPCTISPPTIGWMFLSTPPSRVATARAVLLLRNKRVSIHATLAGGDCSMFRLPSATAMFLSTPPSRVATQNFQGLMDDFVFLSTPPSRVATLESAIVDGDGNGFLSTPPSRVATVNLYINSVGGSVFLSTPPSRVATLAGRPGFCIQVRFYPRHPRGWRRGGGAGIVTVEVFLSTPPSRVATPGAPRRLCHQNRVSIHATLAGGDGWETAILQPIGAFLSTPPSRVATT